MKVKDETKDKHEIQSKGTNMLIYICLPVLIAIGYWFVTVYTREDLDCYQDYSKDGEWICRKKCPPKHFSLSDMDQCIPWLTCDDIESPAFKPGRMIGQGAVKMVYLAKWYGHEMVLNTLAHSKYISDFHHGLEMLRSFQGYPYVTQLLGICRDSFLTEFHKLGSADRIHDILQSKDFQKHNNIDTRLNICISYVEIINFLHNSPLGTRVMCDSNDIMKTLNQYLLQTDLTLLANDLDALPGTDGHQKLIKCGHRQIWDNFAAPEQLWPHENREFNDAEMPPYDEKTDIWKIPNVCDYILGDIQGSDAVRFHLFKIHKHCKEEDPKMRPTAAEVLKIYKDIRDELGL